MAFECTPEATASLTLTLNTFDMTETDWEALGDPNAWQDYINYVPCPAQDTDLTPLSVRVLTDNNIPINTASQGLLTLGTLPGYDIYNQAATNVIKLSLFEELAGSPPRFVEVYANADGEAEFVEIGANTYTGAPRYSVPTRKIINSVDQVACTGFNPPPMIYIRGPYDLLAADGINQETIEYVYPMERLANETCYEERFDRYATIVYRTPILRSDWGDTLDSLYEVQAFEQIIAWIHKILIDDTLIGEDAEVIFSDITPYPLYLAGAGSFESIGGDIAPLILFEDLEPPRVNIVGDIDYETNSLIMYYNIEGVLTDEEVDCWVPDFFDFNQTGIRINIDNSTYVDEQTGQEISDILSVRQIIIKGWATTDNVIIEGGPTAGFKVYCTGRESFFDLADSKDYAWGFDDAGNLKVVLGIGLTEWDKHLISEHNVNIIEPDTIWNGPYIDEADTGGPGEGYLYWQHTGGDANGPAYIISAIWVILERKISSITVVDRKGNAWPALESLTYELYPMIKFDPPAAIAGRSEEPDGFDGIVDHTTCMFDHDPTTVQNLTTCDNTLLNEALSGPSIALTLPFILDMQIDIDTNTDGITDLTYTTSDDSTLYSIADFIYELLNETRDGLTEVSYILGPDETPQLGDNYRDATINSISYSYQDSSSYLITVVAGPRYLKDTVSARDASIWQMELETITREGVITQAAGNGIHYAVNVEGLGDLIAVNTMAGKLPPETGDRVTIQVNNVPKGWK